MTALLMHVWVAYPALVFTMAVVWSLLLYVAWQVIQISRGDR